MTGKMKGIAGWFSSLDALSDIPFFMEE